MLRFLLIGAALFFRFYQVAGAEEVADNRMATDIERMVTQYERKLQRLSTRQALNGRVVTDICEQIL